MTAIGAPASGHALLALAGITKRFGATIAIDDVSLNVRPGTVHALLGENGAGKSTLMRVAFGLLAPDRGRVLVDGAVVQTAVDAIAAGVGMVHQHFTNVPAMTVAENVALGGTGRFQQSRAIERVREIADRTGLALEPLARAEDLSVGAQQRLEIVKALARDARILILDEPTAVLAPAEAEELLRWVRGFADSGNAVVLITHKITEALAVADDITVLRRGRVVASGPAGAESVASISSAMLGGESIAPDAETMSQLGNLVVRAEAMSLVDDRGVTTIRSASIDIHEGEIVGIAGIEGAGQRDLLRALAGRMTIATGTLQIPDAIGFVPEDRHRDALVLDFPPAENVALRAAGARRVRLRWRKLREHARCLIEQFDVRGADERRPVRTLSGGNQQKLVLARELDGGPPLLVVENPTRGLDVRATHEVRDRLRAAAAAGAAVVVYSSDLDEVLSLATRIVAVHAGVVREVARDRDAVGRAMLGVA